MRTIVDEDNITRELNVADLVFDMEADAIYLHQASIDEAEEELLVSQYGYVKFGLMLEKVRNKCMWRRCVQKFLNFREFCQARVNLNIWQVNSAIDAARVALALARLGFIDLPRNASQALKMAKLSIDELGRVWGDVVKNHQSHKITASIIEQTIDPDKEPTSETVRLPKKVANALRGQAIAAGMTLREYLELLADPMADGEDEVIADEVADSAPVELNEEQQAIVDRCEYQWLKPQKIVEVSKNIGNEFDRLMDGLIGKFVPKVRIANE